ncbi:MAG: flippase [Terriglobales bacterium]
MRNGLHLLEGEDTHHRIVASEFVRSATTTFATRIVLMGLGLATTVVVARSLGPEGRGLYAVALTIATLGVQLGNLGLHASNTYYVAKDRSLLSGLIGNTLVVTLGFGGLGAAVAAAVFHAWPALAPVRGWLLFIALLLIPIGLAYLLLQNLLLGLMEAGAYNRIALFSKMLGLGLLGVLVMAGNRTAISYFGVELAAAALGLIWVWSALRSLLDRPPRPSFSLFQQNLAVGLRAYLAGFFALLVLRIDLLMVKYMLGTVEAGYYSVAATLADGVAMLPSVVAMLLFPKLSAMTSNAEKWRFARKTTWVIAAVTLPVAAVFMALARFIVRLLFGAAYLPAASALVWLMPGIFFLGAETVIVQFLNSMGFPKLVVFSWAGCCAANIVLNLWAIPAYGIVGASVVSSICYTLIFFLILRIARRGHHEEVANVGAAAPVISA